MPLPPGLVVKKGTNRLSGFATPEPLSFTLHLEDRAVAAPHRAQLAVRRTRGRRLDRVPHEIGACFAVTPRVAAMPAHLATAWQTCQQHDHRCIRGVRLSLLTVDR